MVGALFGVFIDFDEDIVCRKRLDVANILIYTTKMGRIDEWINVMVMGAEFHVWVVEGGTVVDEWEGSMEEDFEFSKGRGGVWAEKNEEGRPEEAREAEQFDYGEEDGDETDSA